MIPLPENMIGISRTEWESLTEDQRQFLSDANDGGFRYLVEDGGVIAWGATRTGNLFSMDVVESRGGPGESVYTLPLKS